jgi:hypothetical protein
MIKDLPPPLKTVDKRVQKTKKVLLDAFVSLIMEKGYLNVSVQDIIERAKVGRSTFYSHFENKDQLLKGDNMARLLVQDNFESAYSKKREINFGRLYSHVKENQPLVNEIFGKQTSVMMKDHIQNVMVFSLKWLLKNRMARTSIDKHLLSILIEAAGSALSTMLVSWSLDGMKIPIKVMVQKSQEVIDSFFEKYTL